LITFEKKEKKVYGFKHLFKARIIWRLKEESTFATKNYTKSHSIAIEGKELLHVSSSQSVQGAI
jgi:hypothetical protein